MLHCVQSAVSLNEVCSKKLKKNNECCFVLTCWLAQKQKKWQISVSLLNEHKKRKANNINDCQENILNSLFLNVVHMNSIVGLKNSINVVFGSLCFSIGNRMKKGVQY